jgi:glycosyltransferase involved in cell wall biosynthesis
MRVKRALVVAPLMPEYDKESGSQSILDLILFLRDAGWAVSFACENPANGLRYKRLLQQRGVTVYEGFDERLDDLIAYGKLDLTIFCFWYIAERFIRKVRVASPNTRIAINTMDLHFLRNARKLLGAGGGGGLAENGWGSEVARELSTYAAADAVFCVSPKEADLLGEILGDKTVAHVVTDYEHIPPSPHELADRKGILFVGNFRHPPNEEAVAYLCQEVAPRLAPELLAEHPIYIVGNELGPRVRAYADGVSGVRMVGWVPSLTPYYHDSRIAAAPLLHGAGTKRKVLQALTVGLPTVTTSVGIEGFELKAGRDILVADDPDSFADAVTRACSDATLWRRLARNGSAAVSAVFGSEVRDRYLKVVDTVLATEPKRVELTMNDLSDAGPIAYRGLVDRVRRVVEARTPRGARVLVASKGDDRMVRFDHAEGWHFPQSEGGVYAGYYPADSADAIAQLESLRARGAEYVVFPQTAFWWFDHYEGLRDHLQARYAEIADGETACRLYALGSA